jgi:hypothetical protein
LCTGAEQYQVAQNWICGNFTTGDGAGIGHLGLSHRGQISSNTILLNQSFNQGQMRSGGGIFISGQSPFGCPADNPTCTDPALTLSPGAGTVSISQNVIQTNHAGAGDGAGIRVNSLNGQDLPCTTGNCNGNTLNPFGLWYGVEIVNNMIVNNVAGLAGGGISLQDAAKIRIVHNTIARNDSTATTAEAFSPGSLLIPGQTGAIFSNAQPAGIVSRAHSPALAARLQGTGTGRPAWVSSVFSNPELANNIIWQNRSFRFHLVSSASGATTELVPSPPAAPNFWDLGVLGTPTPQRLDPVYSVLTSTAGYATNNTSAPPRFVTPFFNVDRSAFGRQDRTTGLQTAIAFDEGGNFIDVKFGPLYLNGNYHISSGSSAINRGLTVYTTIDIDSQTRTGRPDAGADEIPGATTTLAPTTGGSGPSGGANK